MRLQGPREIPGEGALFFLVPSIFVLFLFVFLTEMAQEIFPLKEKPLKNTLSLQPLPHPTSPDKQALSQREGEGRQNVILTAPLSLQGRGLHLLPTSRG